MGTVTVEVDRHAKLKDQFLEAGHFHGAGDLIQGYTRDDFLPVDVAKALVPLGNTASVICARVASRRLDEGVGEGVRAFCDSISSLPDAGRQGLFEGLCLAMERRRVTSFLANMNLPAVSGMLDELRESALLGDACRAVARNPWDVYGKTMEEVAAALSDPRVIAAVKKLDGCALQKKACEVIAGNALRGDPAGIAEALSQDEMLTAFRALAGSELEEAAVQAVTARTGHVFSRLCEDRPGAVKATACAISQPRILEIVEGMASDTKGSDTEAIVRQYRELWPAVEGITTVAIKSPDAATVLAVAEMIESLRMSPALNERQRLMGEVIEQARTRDATFVNFVLEKMGPEQLWYLGRGEPHYLVMHPSCRDLPPDLLQGACEVLVKMSDYDSKPEYVPQKMQAIRASARMLAKLHDWPYFLEQTIALMSSECNSCVWSYHSKHLEEVAQAIDNPAVLSIVERFAKHPIFWQLCKTVTASARWGDRARTEAVVARCTRPEILDTLELLEGKRRKGAEGYVSDLTQLAYRALLLEEQGDLSRNATREAIISKQDEAAGVRDALNDLIRSTFEPD